MGRALFFSCWHGSRVYAGTYAATQILYEGIALKISFQMALHLFFDTNVAIQSFQVSTQAIGVKPTVPPHALTHLMTPSLMCQAQGNHVQRAAGQPLQSWRYGAPYLAPAWRKVSSKCYIVRDALFCSIADPGACRYFKLNLQSLGRHNTVKERKEKKIYASQEAARIKERFPD
eukprot:1149900-Pelagomonas_calceolata.AAC.1